jgi:hypothetical protein
MSNFDDLLSNAPSEGQRGQFSKEEYAEKKQAEREAAFNLSDSTALDISSDGGKFQQYLDVQSRFMRYSSVNALLILAQKPEAARLGDFDHWKGQGGFVKPGQTGISILEPHEYIKDDGTQGIGYNVKKVFDVSQVDARKIQTKPAPTYSERQILGALISKSPVKINGVDTLPHNMGAMYDPQTGSISVRRGMEFADTFKSVVRELGYYETDKDADKTPVNPSFTVYCATYILCKKHGIDTRDFGFAEAPKVFAGMNVMSVKGELSQIRDAADAISGRMARYFSAIRSASPDFSRKAQSR